VAVLKPIARRARRASATPNPPPAMTVHIGCSGWFYWGWRGKFYPEQLRTDRWFGHYANHFYPD
jgi:hypothetical protein